MNNMKKSARRVFWLLALCFFLLLGYLGKLVMIDRAEISSNSYNIRMRNDEAGIQRGDILDADGEVLATSVWQEDGSYLREYPRARMAAHVTGWLIRPEPRHAGGDCRYRTPRRAKTSALPNAQMDDVCPNDLRKTECPRSRAEFVPEKRRYRL